MRIHVVSSVIKAVSKEVSGLGGKSRPSLLRKTSKEDLQNFDLQKVVRGMARKSANILRVPVEHCQPNKP